MIDVDRLYFEWLVKQLEGTEEDSAVGLEKLCWILYHLPFERRVGLDINRAENGKLLRQEFLYDYEDLNIPPELSNPLLLEEACSWLEMMIRLAGDIDFTYDGGVRGRFLEMCRNAGLIVILLSASEVTEGDIEYVEPIFDAINRNVIGTHGEGGLFPLTRPGHQDQRKVEIWAQASAYFCDNP